MKRPILWLSAAVISIFMASCGSEQREESTSKYKYETVEGDPLGMRIYTLDNGLKVYISENHNEPRVQTNIAVRTGSKQDPADATGLAHYLEHMLFKGTSNLGSLNWEEEKKLLEVISGYYEELRATEEEEARTVIYHRIDSVSQLAAKFVATNEYDKLISSMGAQGTNAYTSNERTVYINDIPSNELEKWLAIESERFGELVLRLFHTELEAVYEEFNRGQDSDFRQAYYKVMELLFPTHPYGTQTTIGTGEHLKNPSMVKIHDYFTRRYVPNNMAVILAGDINPDEAVALVDKYFGKMERKPLEDLTMPKEAPITEPKIADVTGSDAEFEYVAFRLDGAGSKDDLYLELLDGVMSNGTAGLVDLNLVQSQKVLRARTSVSIDEDYSWFMMNGNNREGQSLEEVRSLLLAQIDSVKQGKFEDWMIDAVVRKLKKDLMEQMEANWIRAYMMTDAFILKSNWNDIVTRYDRMQKITKEELVAWTNEKFGNNYVAVNKRIGEKNVYKVDKPEITEVDINRDTSSAFFKEIEKMESGRLKPVFVDYKSAIQNASIGGKVPLNYVHNDINEIFTMYYVFEMGQNNDPWIPLAFKYLPYLGTADMSPAEVQKEMFKLGLSFNVFPSDDRSYVIVSGLKETYKEGVAFFESLLNNVVADKASYDEMIKGLMKERADKKLSKGQILFGGLGSYAKYGAKNPFNSQLSKDELAAANPQRLIDMLHNLTDYEHRIMFYGPQGIDEVVAVLNESHQLPEAMIAVPTGTKFEEIATTENKVYFVEYDMVQTELMMYHRGPVFDESLMPASKIFSEYFGSGLSSIVFQEIRESRALAYSSYAGYTSPSKKDEHHYVRGYLGTQANKLGDATNALLELMSDLPRADQQFEQSKLGAMKQIETNRTYGESILWSYLNAQDRGLDHDPNSVVYPQIETMTFENLQSFFDAQVKDKTYTYAVIGKRSEMDMKALEKLGPVKELTLKEVFGY
ncbi:MAG: insulinase family protein [Flavobacteriales bacterium]